MAFAQNFEALAQGNLCQVHRGELMQEHIALGRRHAAATAFFALTGLAHHCAIPLGNQRRFPFRGGDERSEEHTSELQSLMRISYAVFCLKKKKNKHNRMTYHPNIE